MIDIQRAILQGIEVLHERIDAEILLAHILGESRTYLYGHANDQLGAAEYKLFMDLVHERSAGVPIAYLTKMREFWSLPLTISAATLIPRPETERLVELTLDLVGDEPNAQILELGTGSGAIALAIAKERPNWQITATDISGPALQIAKANAAKLNINNISFYLSDWFDQIPQRRYQAIVSNPPYIAAADPHLSQGDIRYEPVSALVGGKNGLIALQYIIKHSYDYLLPHGLLLLEHGHDQKTAVLTMLMDAGFTDIGTWQDLQGNDRVAGGHRCF